MNFKTFLEAFDSNIKAKITKNDEEHFNVETVINDQRVRFAAQAFGEEWETVFETHDGKGFTYNKTNSSGDNAKQALQIFTFVVECLKELVARRSPKKIEFSSEKSDGNRTSVYARLAKRFTPPGYKMSLVKDGSDYRDYFTFTKIEAK